jgi:hypothetical protein
MNSDNEAAKKRYHQVRELYSQLLNRNLDDNSIRKLQDSINALEKQLTSTFVSTGSLENGLSLTWKFTIKKSLSENEAAIEFAVIPELKRNLRFLTDSIDT